MSDDNRFGGNSRTPVGGAEDFGFFATPRVEPPSHFGGPPALPPAYPPPAAARPVAPAPVAALAQQQAPSQFGPPPGPFAQPWQPGPGQPYAPAQRSGLPVWAIVVICVPVGFVVLAILAAIAIPVFLNQRSTPVMPDSVRGVSRTTDPALTQAGVQARERLISDNPGSKIDVAGYGSAQSGYVVEGANLRMDPAQEFGSLGTDAPMYFGAIQCGNNNTSHVSMCLRVGTRGSVKVIALGGSDLSELALETSKVWAAQPFGN